MRELIHNKLILMMFVKISVENNCALVFKNSCSAGTFYNPIGRVQRHKSWIS